MIEVENRNTSFAGVPEHASDAIGVHGGYQARWRQMLEPAVVARLEALTESGMEALRYERATDGPVRAPRWAGRGVDAMAALARYRPASFNQLASRDRYPGLRPGDLAS
jgi:hypothetical protein